MAGAPDHPIKWWRQHPEILAAARAERIGEFVHAYRLAHHPKLSQRTIGGWIGYSQPGMSDLENGETDLGHGLLTHILRTLKVPRDLWWFAPTETDDGLGLTYDPDIANSLAMVLDLGRSDMNRRSFLRAFSAAAAVSSSRDWLIETLNEAISARGRVSGAQVQAIRETFDVWNELDVIHGGGHARAQLTSYVTGHVIPLLASNSVDTAAGRDLFEAAAEQLYILSRMAYDDGEMMLAEGYLVQALRLAQEAVAPDLGAHILAGLSDQASFAGHAREAVQLARTGLLGLTRRPSPACEARLLVLQAKAEAATGDQRATTATVLASEAAFDRVVAGEEPSWARYIDVAYLSGECANAYRNLGAPVETERFAAASIVDAERQGRGRRGAFAQATLARAAIVDHNLERAGAAATVAVRLASSVRSTRSVAAVNDLRIRLRPHRASPAVREFLETADLLLA